MGMDAHAEPPRLAQLLEKGSWVYRPSRRSAHIWTEFFNARAARATQGAGPATPCLPETPACVLGFGVGVIFAWVVLVWRGCLRRS